MWGGDRDAAAPRAWLWAAGAGLQLVLLTLLCAVTYSLRWLSVEEFVFLPVTVAQQARARARARPPARALACPENPSPRESFLTTVSSSPSPQVRLASWDFSMPRAAAASGAAAA